MRCPIGRGCTRGRSLFAAFCCGLGCSAPTAVPTAHWELVVDQSAAALLSVSGTARDDVWLAGADDGTGPLVLHWDGSAWERRQTSTRANLWWVQALADGSVFLGGSAATVLHYRDGAFQRENTPGPSSATVFGVWAAAEDDVYAVGSVSDQAGFLWHSTGQTWSALALSPELLPPDGELPALYKVWGASTSDVWVVGDRGLVLRGNARDGFRRLDSGFEDRLFTVNGAGGHVAMVGGLSNGYALEADGDRLLPITPPGAAPLQGVCVTTTGALWAVGFAGSIYTRDAAGAGWHDIVTDIPAQSLHGVWVDPGGGVWSVGGNVLTSELDHGLAIHFDPGWHVAQAALE